MCKLPDKVQPKNKVQLKSLIDHAFNHNIYDLNFIDTSKITDMSNLFEDIRHNFDVSKWDMSNVIDISFMFYGCHNFNCDLSRWNVSKVENMYSTFGTCKNFIGKGLENWNVSNVRNMTGMFAGCEKFDCDLSNWDVSNVIDMKFTFNYCLNFKGKGLEQWNVSNVEDFREIFYKCSKVTIPNWYWYKK